MATRGPNQVSTSTGASGPLSPLEAGLLRYLSDRPNQEISREELMREVWGRSLTTRSVDVTMSRLRQKLGEADPPQHLRTVHGVGYRFVPHDPAAGPVSPIPPGPRPLIRTAGGILDLDRGQLEQVDGGIVPLSRLDTAVLRRLASPLGHPVALDDIARDVWGRGHHRPSVAAAVARLRRKLERDPARPEVLVTAPGFGVRLEGDAAVRGARTNLVPIGSSFIAGAGFEELCEAAARHRLLTLCGTAGVGKTRLACRLGSGVLASEPSVEVWRCDLGTVSDLDGVAATVAREIGLDPSGRDPLGQLGRVLARRPPRSVLILDGFEHLVPFASLVSAWRDAAPDLRIWVTSRVALDLPGEVRIEVPALEEEEAVRLFVDRATGGIDPGSPTVRALVRCLDGLPLAIELAAARVHQLTPEGLLARLGEPLDLLVRRGRDTASHHPTLRGAFDGSWDLLTGQERRALAALSVLVSPFDGATAHALLGQGSDALVDRLGSCSLVHPAGDDRFCLLQTIRAYAAEKLVLSGERDSVLTRRAGWVLDRAERLVSTLDGAEGGASQRALSGMRDEILAVERTAADADTAGRAAMVMADIDYRTGRIPSLVELLERTIARGPSVELLWQLWWRLAATSTAVGADERATRELEQAYALAERHSERARALVLRKIGMHEGTLGRYAEARRCLTEARAVLLSVGERAWAAKTLGSLAYLELRLGSSDAGLLEQAVSELRACGEVRFLATQLIRLSEAMSFVGRFDRARAHLTEALELARACDDPIEQLRARMDIAVADLQSGAFAAADTQLRAIGREYHELGIPIQEDVVRLLRGVLASEMGDLDTAEAHLSREYRSNAATRLLQTMNLAVVRLLRGDSAAARTLLSSIDVGPDHQHRYWVCNNSYLALAAALEGDLADASERLADVRRRYDRQLFGIPRFLDLCTAVVDLVRDRAVDPTGAILRAERVLAAGDLVVADTGCPVERPLEANTARTVLVGVLGRSRGGSL